VIALACELDVAMLFRRQIMENVARSSGGWVN